MFDLYFAEYVSERCTQILDEYVTKNIYRDAVKNLTVKLLVRIISQFIFNYETYSQLSQMSDDEYYYELDRIYKELDLYEEMERTAHIYDAEIDEDEDDGYTYQKIASSFISDLNETIEKYKCSRYEYINRYLTVRTRKHGKFDLTDLNLVMSANDELKSRLNWIKQQRRKNN